MLQNVLQYTDTSNGKLLISKEDINPLYHFPHIRQYLVGLYRDDGLVKVTNLSGPEIKKKRIAIIKLFKKCGLNITRQTILKIVNFFDVEMNLDTDTYRQYRNQVICQYTLTRNQIIPLL